MSPEQKNIFKKLGLFLLFLCAIIIITWVAPQLGGIVNPTTIGFSFLILVVTSAVFAGLWVAIAISITATLFFNYFFLPPIGTFHIADFDNWVALFAFLFTAIVISRLTASAHENAIKSEILEITLKRLREFGNWLLTLPRDRVTLSGIAENAVRILGLEYCSIHVYAEGKWHHFSGASVGNLPQQVAESLKVSGDHPTAVMELVEEQGLGVRYSQIRTGPGSFALLAVKSDYLPTQAIDAMASMIGLLLVEALREMQLSKNGSQNI